MGIHLLAFAFVQVFQVSAPLLWSLNLWLPLARRLPEACAVARAALAAHVAWLLTVSTHGQRQAAPRKRGESVSVPGLSAMGIHLLAFAFVQVFQASAPLLWPLNLWLPRHLPQLFAVVSGEVAAHVAWLRRAHARRRDDDDEARRQGLLYTVY
ncbi:unnamed protein product [Triticum aestivum]|uniref:Uncharacterized protein n=1 Tax=Triticum aestivum TaxID=4565 RepID=A0A7H4LPI9_WHEAT|nr:unnamed protein product [Triticum aestivum]